MDDFPATQNLTLPPLVKRLGWVSLFTDAASEMIYPLLPAFLLSLGGTAASLGRMEGIAESISAFVKWWAGRASDRTSHRKPFVVMGYALATAARSLMAIAVAPWHVIVFRATDRVGKGIRSAPRDALVAGAVKVEQRGLAFGFHRMMDNLGAAIGPLLAFALVRYTRLPLRSIFLVAIVPALVALGTLVWGVRETGPRAQATSKSEHSNVARPLSSNIKRYLGIVALFTLGASADSFLLLRIMDLGLSASWIPMVWLSLSVSKAVTNFPGGALSDRFGRRSALAAAWLVYAIAYFLFPLTHSIPLTWILLVAYGAYYGLAEGGERAIVGDYSEPSTRGRAYGAFHAVTGIAVLPANLIFGHLYTKAPGTAFVFSACCALGAAVALMVYCPPPKKALSGQSGTL